MAHMARGACRAWRGVLAAATVLVVADVASRLACSEAAIVAQVDLAVQRAATIQSGVAVPEAARRRPRLRVTALP